MILFSMAWVLPGEQVLNFTNYTVGVAVILAVVVWLALYSNKLYEMGDKVPPEGTVAERKRVRHEQLFVWILVFEGVVILVTWILLMNWGYSRWMISLCGLVFRKCQRRRGPAEGQTNELCPAHRQRVMSRFFSNTILMLF
jgi:hypothetical protein